MSSTEIWVILPLGLALLIFLLRYRTLLIYFSAVITTFWLALLAWLIPFDQAILVGSISVKVTETFEILGREFTLSNADRPFLVLLYLFTSLWILAGYFIKPDHLFAPFALGMVASLTAALAVEPFLFAAMIIEIISLLAVPLLAPPGQPSGKGVLRFLAFQTIGMPFILFTGWMLSGVEASPGNIDLVVRSGILLGIGFAFMLAVFPFHSWIPMLAEESHPFIAAFILFMLPTVVSLFGLSFLDRFVWLRDSESVLGILRAIGVLMVLFGGIWSTFENHLGRLMGYAVVIEIGLSILAAGLGLGIGVIIFFWMIIPRGISLIIWSISLSQLKVENSGELHLIKLKGAGFKNPYSAGGLLLAHFSLAGVPILAAFPVRWVLWQHLAGYGFWVLGAVILGSIGLMVGGLRTLGVLFTNPVVNKIDDSIGDNSILDNEILEEYEDEDTQRPTFLSPPALLFGVYLFIMLWIGLFPHKYIGFIENMTAMFGQIGG